MQTQFVFCAFSVSLGGNSLSANYQTWFADPIELQTKSVLLTDCANAYRSVCGLSAASSEKNVRLLPAHIRDRLVTNLLSYVDALVNLADVGAKIKNSLARWRNVATTGSLRVSFLGRAKAKRANI